MNGNKKDEIRKNSLFVVDLVVFTTQINNIIPLSHIYFGVKIHATCGLRYSKIEIAAVSPASPAPITMASY
jgi:hypothetical protein